MASSKMSKSDQAKVAKAFEQKCPNAVCPMCGPPKAPWDMTTNPWETSENESPNSSDGDDTKFNLIPFYTPLHVAVVDNKERTMTSVNVLVPAVTFVCKTCGYVSLFASKYLAGVPKVGDDDDEA